VIALIVSKPITQWPLQETSPLAYNLCAGPGGNHKKILLMITTILVLAGCESVADNPGRCVYGDGASQLGDRRGRE
jgi:hypothetical protein